MRTFILSLVVVAVTGDAKPYTIGQVAAGLTNGGIITSVGGQAVVPHRAPVAVPNVYTVPHVYGAHHVYYGKRSADPYTVGQVAAGLTNGGIITSVGGQAVVPHRAPVAVPNVYTVPHVYGAHHVYYGKRSADPYTIGQVAAGQTNGGIITSVGGVPVVPHHAPVAGAVPHVYTAGVAHHVPLVYYG